MTYYISYSHQEQIAKLLSIGEGLWVRTLNNMSLRRKVDRKRWHKRICKEQGK